MKIEFSSREKQSFLFDKLPTGSIFCLIKSRSRYAQPRHLFLKFRGQAGAKVVCLTTNEDVTGLAPDDVVEKVEATLMVEGREAK